MRDNRIESAVRHQNPANLIHGRQTVLVVALSLGAAVWAAALLIGGPRLELEEFLLLATGYGVLSACFVIHRVQGSLAQLFDIPVFITIIAFLRFGLAPIYTFFDPSLSLYTSHGDKHTLLQALLYIMLGMVAFWFGCSWVRRAKNTTRDSIAESNAPAGGMGTANSILVWALAFFAASFASRVYLLHEHMYSYTESLAAYYQHLASAQVLYEVSQFGTYAMILAGIERYSHPSNMRWRLVFNVIFISECLWGLISGMKGALLWNFVLVALMSSIVQKKLRIWWVLALIPTLVLMYPFSNQYRFLIRTEGMKITSISDARKVVSQALFESVRNQSGPVAWLGTGAESVASRLDLLDSVSSVIWMGPELADVRTRGHWWLLPFYPFVPRFLWPSKPVEDVGLEFNLALGGNDESASAITYPGDLYLEFGVPGIVVGMFCLGLFGQWLTNKVRNPLSKGGLFLYAALFANMVGLEDDVFGFWTAIIKWLAILSVVIWLVYLLPGRAQHASRLGQAVRIVE